MFDVHRARVAAYFDSLVQQHGKSYRACDFGQRRSQEVKYEVMAALGEMRGASVLDVGCGMAFFFDYLVEQGLRPSRYVGIDVSPKMVDGARELHPRLDIRLGDVLELDGEEQFNFVVANGLLYIDFHEDYATALIARIAGLCTRGAAISTTSTYARSIEPGEHYSRPEDLFSLAKKVCQRVVLRHDYASHDFTLYLYPGEFRY